MAAFTRVAVVALTGMTSHLLRRKKRPGEPEERPGRRRIPGKPAPTAAVAAQPATPAAPDVAAPVKVAEAAPENVDHFRSLPPKPGAPLVATIAARSLPLVGILGTLATLTLGVGVYLGELPYIGPIENANLAWAAALVTISLWAVYLLWKVPQWQAAAWARSGNPTPRELFQIENDSRGTLGQILSGVAVLTGLIFAWQQLGQTSDNLRVSEEGQITDRYSRAVDQLGSDQFTIRLGGIYALERIARDSPRDYGPVMEVLTAFARQESPVSPDAAATAASSAPEVPLDVRAVFKVIGRRSAAQIATEMEEGGCLDLTGINAVGVDLAEYNLQNTCWDRSDLRGAIASKANLADTTFAGANLQQANFDRVKAQRARFDSARLVGTNLSQSDLAGANLLAANLTSALLPEANLTDANLQGANLTSATMFGANLNGADMVSANLTGALLTDADLSGAEHLNAEQVTEALTNKGTKLPEGIDAPPDF